MSNSVVRKLNVWSNVLQEETLCDDLSNVGLIQPTDAEKSEQEAIKQQRGIESYSYKNKALDEHFNNSKQPQAKPTARRRNKKSRNKTSSANRSLPLHTPPALSKSKSSTSSLPRQGEAIHSPETSFCVTYDETKSRSHIRASELDSDQVVIKEIVSQLREPNSDIITRCVNVLGKKKSLELLYATEDIQASGGMLTADGLRCRTSGGVYLQLVKTDETILKCQRSQIIIQEVHQKKRKNAVKRLKKKLKLEKEKQLNASSKSDTTNRTDDSSAHEASTSKSDTQQDENNVDEQPIDDKEFNEINENEMISFDE